MKFLLDNTVRYRVDTVAEALALRDNLQKLPNAELVSFSYTTKLIKEKGEVVGEYQVVKAKLDVNNEKEPETASLDMKITGIQEDDENYEF